jgi:hypothetical protein
MFTAGDAARPDGMRCASFPLPDGETPAVVGWCRLF